MLFATRPLEFLLAIGVSAALILKNLYWDNSKRVVMRMDLNPDTETISVLKIGSFALPKWEHIHLRNFQIYQPNSLNHGIIHSYFC